MSVRRLLTDRSAQVAGVALAAIFLIAIAFPWDDKSRVETSTAGFGVFALLGISIVTTVYLGAAARLPILTAAAFTSAAMAAYILGNAFDYQFDLRGVGWPTYQDSGRLFGYNLGDLADRLVIWSVFAAPVGAMFGALGLAFGRTLMRRSAGLRGGLKAWHLVGIGLLAVFVIGIAFPWDPIDGSAYIPAFAVAAAITAITAIAVGSRSPATLRSGALFGVLAIATYNIACFIDYEMAWRGNTWSPWDHQEALWGSHAALVAYGLLFLSPPLAAAGAVLAWAGEAVTGGRFKGHGQQAAG